MQSGQLVVRWVQERVVLLFLGHWFRIAGIGMMKVFVIESFVAIIQERLIVGVRFRNCKFRRQSDSELNLQSRFNYLFVLVALRPLKLLASKLFSLQFFLTHPLNHLSLELYAKSMSIVYRSSLLFSHPSHYTISHMQVQDALYEHKKKLSINHRSTSRDLNYKTQRLSARQVRTIENLSQKTRTYSLNTLLRTYHSRLDNHQNAFSQSNSPSKDDKSHKQYFQTIDNQSSQENAFICPEKLKLFKAGVNYRSNQRARGTGVKKVNMEDLKTYFDRCPEEQIDFKQLKKHQAIRKNSKIQQQTPHLDSRMAYKSSRIQSSRNFLH